MGLDLPIRGYCVSAKFTCPGCGKILNAKNLHLMNGFIKCGQCHRVMIVSLKVWKVPPGIKASSIKFPDYDLPPEEGTEPLRRRRTRTARKEALAELEMDDPLPILPHDRYQVGTMANSADLVGQPRTGSP